MRLFCNLQLYLARRRVARIRSRLGARDYRSRELLGNQLGAIAYRLTNECGIGQREAADVIGYSRTWTSVLISRHAKALGR